MADYETDWTGPGEGHMEAPNKYGGGTVFWHERRQRWTASYELPRARGEARRRRSRSAATRREVEDWLAEQERPIREGVGRAVYLERAREKGTHTEGEWWALVRSVMGRCHYCGVKTEAALTPADHPLHTQRDHLVPVCRGGSDAIENVVVSCRRCNMEKGTMTADEYLAWKEARNV